MLKTLRRRKTALAIVAIALAIAITTIAVACKPTGKRYPAVETFSTECKAIAKGSLSRAKLESLEQIIKREDKDPYTLAAELGITISQILIAKQVNILLSIPGWPGPLLTGITEVGP